MVEAREESLHFEFGQVPAVSADWLRAGLISILGCDWLRGEHLAGGGRV